MWKYLSPATLQIERGEKGDFHLHVSYRLVSLSSQPRMDQYFNQMEKIVKERKTSSRIRFMLQDVIDLRLVSVVMKCFIVSFQCSDLLWFSVNFPMCVCFIEHFDLLKSDGGYSCQILQNGYTAALFTEFEYIYSKTDGRNTLQIMVTSKAHKLLLTDDNVKSFHGGTINS